MNNRIKNHPIFAFIFSVEFFVFVDFSCFNTNVIKLYDFVQVKFRVNIIVSCFSIRLIMLSASVGNSVWRRIRYKLENLVPAVSETTVIDLKENRTGLGGICINLSISIGNQLSCIMH